MKLNLYDGNLNRVAIIGTSYKSCMWSEGYNTLQPFTLELEATDRYKSLIKPDCFVGRDDRKTLMIIKSVNVHAGSIVANGKQAARCLDDVAFIGTLRAGSELPAALKSAYDASDKYSNMEFSGSGPAVRYAHDISNKSFLTLIETVCQDTDTGFRVIKSGNKMIAELYKPSAKPNYILSEPYGNLRVESISLSTENKKNRAIVLGAGEGEARKRITVDLSKGDAARTMVIDARDITQAEGESQQDYEKRLEARGYEELLQKQGTWEISIKPLPQAFEKSYDLGDIITVLLPDYGIKLKSRVTRFTQQSQDNVIKTTLEIGTITIIAR